MIDLRSDTVTQPSLAMRRAMAEPTCWIPTAPSLTRCICSSTTVTASEVTIADETAVLNKINDYQEESYRYLNRKLRVTLTTKLTDPKCL